MRVRDVILQAIAGKMTWLQAADVLGMSPRTLRRWRRKFQEHGIDRLVDRRRQRPSARAIPEAELRRWLRLYRDRYCGYNARHFWATCRREHGLTWSYTLLRTALQAAGLVRKHRPRGRHFRRREPRACCGELLHLDGSRHRWLERCPEDYQHLIVVVDDATRQILYARLEGGESSPAVMRALAAVLRTHGIPQALYTDRASWAACTRGSEGRPRDDRPTKMQRALKRYLEQHFLAAYNAEFGRVPGDPASAFVPLGSVDLEPILCHEEERVVANDNTVHLDGVRPQIDKQPGRVTCAGLTVTVRRHLDGTHTVTWGKRRLGRYDDRGRRLENAVAPTPSTGAAA